MLATASAQVCVPLGHSSLYLNAAILLKTLENKLLTNAAASWLLFTVLHLITIWKRHDQTIWQPNAIRANLQLLQQQLPAATS